MDARRPPALSLGGSPLTQSDCRAILRKVSFFDRFRRRPWSLAGVPRPWGDAPSLYEHVKAQIDPKTGRLCGDGERLPDRTEEGGVLWAAGALDGVMSHHAGAADEELRVKQLANAVRDLLTSATEANLAHVYRLSSESILGILDQVTTALLEDDRIDPERLHELGRTLSLEAPDRETVKFGIALMGLVQGPDDSDVLSELGLHEEFTLFCAVAIGRQSESAEERLWELAKKVDGWGRIHIVERLAETENAEIRAWLLREGFRNSVMDEYLAYTCAMAGHLHEALRVEHVDDALLSGASGIFAALARGGPAEDLASYAHAEAAISSWLVHVEKRPLTLAHIEALDALARRDQISDEMKKRIEVLRRSEDAVAAIQDGLDSSDQTLFGLADHAARSRGMETFGHHARRLRQTCEVPAYHLFRLMQDADEQRIDEALEVANQHIELAWVATGPANELGVGPGTEPYHLLDSVLQELARFPGRGTPFLMAGLRSPVIRNRNMAARALASWGPARWPQELAEAVAAAVPIEPNAELKERLERIVAGGRFEQDEEDSRPS